MKRTIERLLTAWYACDARERKLIGRIGLLVLVLAATHSVLGAMALWLAVDWLIEGHAQIKGKVKP